MESELSKKYNTPYRIIRRFIRVALFYGYQVSISNRHKGSCYVDFCEIGKDTISFKFRFSDHILSKNNQIPSGVINEFTNLTVCIRDIQFYHEFYKKMSKSEKKQLYTNRFMDY